MLNQLKTNANTNVARGEAEAAASSVKRVLAEQKITKLTAERVKLQALLTKAEKAGNYKDAEKALKHLNKLTAELTAQQEEYNQAIERTAGALRKTVTQEFNRISQGIRPAIQNMIREGADLAVQQTRRAHQAMIATAREVPRSVTEATQQLGRATIEYEQMMASATMTALRYGQTVAEVTEAQDHLVRSLSINITQLDNAGEVIGEVTDNLAWLGQRAHMSTGEMVNFAEQATMAFGAGTLNDLQEFSREFTAAAQIPAILNRELEAAGQNMGATFNDPMMMRMVQEWTLNFADQATNIGEMTAAMMSFRKRMVEAGVTGVRSMNNMQQAMARGIMGRRGHDANTVLAGTGLLHDAQQAIRERNEGNSEAFDRMTRGMDEMDRRLFEQYAEGGTGMDASYMFHLMKTRPEGMEAMLDNLVGVTRGANGNTAIAAELLASQGFDTGDETSNARLAMILQARERGEQVDMTEVESLLSTAQENEQQGAEDRREVYRNVGAIEEMMAQTVGFLGNILSTLTDNFGRGGGGIGSQLLTGLLGGAGGAGIMSRLAGGGGGSFLSGLAARLGIGAAATGAGGTAAGTLGAGVGTVGGGTVAGATALAGSVGLGIGSLIARLMGVSFEEQADSWRETGEMITDAFSSSEGLWRGDGQWTRRSTNGREHTGAENVSDFRQFLQTQYDEAGMIVDDAEMSDLASAVRSARETMTAEEFAGVRSKLDDLGILEEMQGLEGMQEVFDRQRTQRSRDAIDSTVTPPTQVTPPPGAPGASRDGRTPADGTQGSNAPVQGVRPANLQLASNGNGTVRVEFEVNDLRRVVGEASAQNAISA